MNKLKIQNLSVFVKEKKILEKINLEVKSGEIHILMGPNGAGKTSLAMALAGHLGYRAKGKGSRAELNRHDLLALKPEERARSGLFVSFQQPVEVPGVSVLSFLRTAERALNPKNQTSLSDFKKEAGVILSEVGLGEDFLKRSLNEDFSGGEKKKLELAQLLIFRPRFAVLDEIDSGLDLDSVKMAAKKLAKLAKTGSGIILITHYPRILAFLKPTRVHVLVGGQIKASNGMSLVAKIEKEGYAAV